MTSRDLCCCPELDDLVIVGMGDPEGLDERIFKSLDIVKDHGDPQWWLYASKCSVCGQSWMVAQDERVHDNFCLKRLDESVMGGIVGRSEWPEDFLHYERVLRIERQAGKIAQFLDPHSPALIDTVTELRRERPDISVDDIAYALAVSPKSAGRLVSLSKSEAALPRVGFLRRLFKKRTVA